MNMIIACILDDKFLNVILLHAVLLVVIYEHFRPRAWTILQQKLP